MATNVSTVVDAFELLYGSLWDREFCKATDFRIGERSLLKYARVFLLGYFGHYFKVEIAARLPGSIMGAGRVDFLIDDVAVEFAVRTANDPRSKVLPSTNQTEIKKLLLHPGKALLVLFDFHDEPCSGEDLDAYRELPSLGRGSFKKSAFNVAYFHSAQTRPRAVAVMRKSIRLG
ncbi:MAG: hypothetical protein EA385_15325 [Salinarimonadaceae bacterium]|nr:MAG: hypothetical protein EA385_15325 [Salinarimonadaceae bacterium]